MPALLDFLINMGPLDLLISCGLTGNISLIEVSCESGGITMKEQFELLKLLCPFCHTFVFPV